MRRTSLLPGNSGHKRLLRRMNCPAKAAYVAYLGTGRRTSARQARECCTFNYCYDRRLGHEEVAMPAVTVPDILLLPRISEPDAAVAEERKVVAVTTAPSGYEG